MPQISIRRLTKSGLEKFRQHITGLRQDPTLPPPLSLLTDDAVTESAGLPNVSIDTDKMYVNRFEFAKAIFGLLEPVREKNSNWLDDDGLWGWLALAFLAQTCPDGKPGEDARHIPSREYNRRYRHLVRSAVLLYSLHQENSRFALLKSLNLHGEAAEQVLSRQHILTNKALFSAFTSLYSEIGKKGPKMKRGANSKNTGGTLRRAGKVLKQFDLTFDLNAMDHHEILKLFPPEFDRFKPRG
jgi:hypothetical protein